MHCTELADLSLMLLHVTLVKYLCTTVYCDIWLLLHIKENPSPFPATLHSTPWAIKSHFCCSNFQLSAMLSQNCHALRNSVFWTWFCCLWWHFATLSTYKVVKKVFYKHNIEYLIGMLGTSWFLLIYAHNNLTFIMNSDFYLKITFFQRRYEKISTT
jgi:hypothetical protein